MIRRPVEWSMRGSSSNSIARDVKIVVLEEALRHFETKEPHGMTRCIRALEQILRVVATRSSRSIR